MSRICELTGIRPLAGNKVSHSNIKTKTRRLPNLKKKKYSIPELSRSMTLTLSVRAIRTIDHQSGISRAILKADKKKLSTRLLQVRNQLEKASRTPLKSKKTKPGQETHVA